MRIHNGQLNVEGRLIFAYKNSRVSQQLHSHRSTPSMAAGMYLSRALFAIIAFASGTHGADNGLAITPQMGWNTWNHFGCDISEDTIMSAAQAIVNYNLTQFGYECEIIVLLRYLAYVLTCCHWGRRCYYGRLYVLHSPV